jgi:PA14 domain-containing protein
MSPVSPNSRRSTVRPSRFLAAAVGLAALCYASRLAIGPEHGLQAEYFAGEHPGGAPALSGVDRDVTTDSVQRRWYGAMSDTFSAQWFGYLTAPSAGRYTFGLTSDDAARLSVDGRLLIDNSGRHAAITRTAETELARGPHAVLIEFTQYGGDFAIGWQWGRDARSLVPVPSWATTPYRAMLWRVVGAHLLDLVAIAALAMALVLAGWIGWRNREWFSRHPRWATLGLFVALAIVHTWPLASDPAHLARHDNRDTMLNEWIVAWVAHQMPRNPLHLFDGNIFYPERDSLAYSEPLFPQAAMAMPLFVFGASPVLAYNILLIAGFTLSGWAMCLVIRSWTGDWSAGVIAGAVFAFNAHLLSRIPHLQAQHVEFLPAALFALDALLSKPSIRRALALALWAALQATTSVYLLASTFFALAAGILSRPRDWLGTRFLPFARALAVATAVAAAVLVPFLLPYYHANHDLGLTRSLSDASMYGATWGDYLSTPSRLMYSLWSYRFFAGTALFPGAVGLALAAVACVRGDAFRDPRARMCLVVGIAGVLLSLGPRMPGYAVLYALVPVLRAIRATARFGYLATLSVAALAGFGVASLRRSAPARPWTAITVVLLAAASAESLVAPLGLTRFDGIPPIYSRVSRDANTRVVEIPFFGSTSSQFHASYMLNSTAHWRPIVNGYSGFQPPSFYQHAGILQGFPDEASLAMLHDLGVTHVFVHTTQMPKEALDAINRDRRLKHVETFGSISLYRLE